MSRRTRTYVAFDADEDMSYYRLFQAWDENDGFDFDFNNVHELTRIWPNSSEDTIKRHLRERMENAKKLVVLVGEKTHKLRKYVPYEIELALKAGIPIIVVNLNKKRSYDSDLCPALLKNVLAIHVGYHAKIIQYALDNWPSSFESHKANGGSGPFYYRDEVYKKLGIDTGAPRFAGY